MEHDQAITTVSLNKQRFQYKGYSDTNGNCKSCIHVGITAVHPPPRPTSAAHLRGPSARLRHLAKRGMDPSGEFNASESTRAVDAHGAQRGKGG